MATYYVRTRAGRLAGNSLTELAILTAGALDAGGEPRLSMHPLRRSSLRLAP
jgi:hypothetical protein